MMGYVCFLMIDDWWLELKFIVLVVFVCWKVVFQDYHNASED